MSTEENGSSAVRAITITRGAHVAQIKILNVTIDEQGIDSVAWMAHYVQIFFASIAEVCPVLVA